MNGFQVITLAAITGISGFVLAAVAKHRLSWRAGTAWLAVWVAAGVAIAKPDLTVIAARALGIRRGADLVLYIGMLSMSAGFFAVYVRLRKLEGTITQIVRHIAIEGPAAPTESAEPTRRTSEGP